MHDLPFDDLDQFIALPRVESLALSPDGSWAAATVATLSADKTAWERSIWRITVAGTPHRCASPGR